MDPDSDLVMQVLKDPGDQKVLVVVVYQCSISNVMYTGDIEVLFVLVHALC